MGTGIDIDEPIIPSQFAVPARNALVNRNQILYDEILNRSV